MIEAPEDYIERCESGVIEKDDATEELFTAPFQTSVSTPRDALSSGKFEEGMKLEAVDPLNLGSICVATVMKVKVFFNGFFFFGIFKYKRHPFSYVS